MASAISIGQTGLVASSKQMDVIANNLANSSTVGFKSSSTLFASMMGQGLSSTGTLSVGQGVGVVSLPTQFSQGSFENTGNVTDMAIDGEGFFIVNEPSSAPLYTRAGAFHIDNDNNLVDIKGYKVQGYATGSVVQDDIVLQKNIDATATTEIGFGANLDQSTATGETFEVSQTVYDSLGSSHSLSLVFTKAAASGEWTVAGTFPGATATTVSLTLSGVAAGETVTLGGVILTATNGATAVATEFDVSGTDAQDAEALSHAIDDITGYSTTTHSGAVVTVAYAPAGVPTDIDTGDITGAHAGITEADILGVTLSTTTVTFDSAGALILPAGDITITILPNPLANGATIGTAGSLSWNITSDATRKLTGYSSESAVRSLYANGYAAGELRRLSVDGKGIISGVYTNGQTLEMCQLALASFQDQSGLASSGNYFLETNASGQPASNRAGTAGLGNIQGNSLESSNTDVSKEFISMITAQRAYQANAKVITTADQMLTELMNIKR